MDRFIHITAYLANIALIGFAFIVIYKTYGADTYFAMLLLVPPCLSIWALYTGPDLEERKLKKQLNKARMENELLSLSKKTAK